MNHLFGASSPAEHELITAIPHKVHSTGLQYSSGRSHPIIDPDPHWGSPPLQVISAGQPSTHPSWKMYAMWTIAGSAAIFAGVRLYQRRVVQQNIHLNSTDDGEEDVSSQSKQSCDGGEEPQGEMPPEPTPQHTPCATSQDHQQDFVLVATVASQDAMLSTSPRHSPFTLASTDMVRSEHPSSAAFDFCVTPATTDTSTEQDVTDTTVQFVVVDDEANASTTSSYSSSDGGSSLCPDGSDPHSKALKPMRFPEQSTSVSQSSTYFGGWTSIFGSTEEYK